MGWWLPVAPLGGPIVFEIQLDERGCGDGVNGCGHCLTRRRALKVI
jgi:hypothetical protein